MSTLITQNLPRYDITRTYDWNYAHPPERIDVDVPGIPGEWSFCGIPVASPLGIPAGPLLNGRWLLYYAGLGFDTLTYKTVRSGSRACYPLPNLLPVELPEMMRGGETAVPAASAMRGSWAVSFGMPSQPPDVWRKDVAWTREQLDPGKVLSVSVVGAIQPDWSLQELAEDYAMCAHWAVESGADCVETNFSCPNVSTCDGQLYLQPDAARTIAQAVRDAIGPTPYLVKIGHVSDQETASAIVAALAESVDALAMTNSVAATVVDERQTAFFDGQPRGICGSATLEASISQVERFRKAITEQQAKLEIVGVGGAATVADVRRFLTAGAANVHIATAAMVDPSVGLQIRREFAAGA